MYTSFDLIAICSFIIGLQNLEENRQQTADNDVNKANDKQAKFLLEEINKKFDEIKELIINDRNGNIQ